MGRHREFDVDDALGAALQVFWRQGFEGASLTDLTEAMAITRPSLYAAFGNKETLFRKALDRYQATCMAFLARALEEPTARCVVETILLGSADALTDQTHPPGCLGINGALVCSEAADPVRHELIRRREAVQARLRARLDRAISEGDLAAGTDTADLASYVMTVVHGMSVQAASGADRDTLHAVVRTALRAWPA